MQCLAQELAYEVTGVEILSEPIGLPGPAPTSPPVAARTTPTILAGWPLPGAFILAWGTGLPGLSLFQEVRDMADSGAIRLYG